MTSHLMTTVSTSNDNIRIFFPLDECAMDPEDLDSLYFLEVLDIHHAPESSDESYVLNLKLSHPKSLYKETTSADFILILKTICHGSSWIESMNRFIGNSNFLGVLVTY